MKTQKPKSGIILIQFLVCLILLFSACQREESNPERFAMVIGLKPEKMVEYNKLHADTWPEILELIRKVNIRNYSIHLGELEKGKFYLFAYFEYHGDNFQEDMDFMAADSTMQKWWELTDQCQIPSPMRKEGEFWMKMEEVFYTN